MICWVRLDKLYTPYVLTIKIMCMCVPFVFILLALGPHFIVDRGSKSGPIFYFCITSVGHIAGWCVSCGRRHQIVVYVLYCGIMCELWITRWERMKDKSGAYSYQKSPKR